MWTRLPYNGSDRLIRRLVNENMSTSSILIRAAIFSSILLAGCGKSTLPMNGPRVSTSPPHAIETNHPVQDTTATDTKSATTSITLLDTATPPPANTLDPEILDLALGTTVPAENPVANGLYIAEANGDYFFYPLGYVGPIISPETILGSGETDNPAYGRLKMANFKPLIAYWQLFKGELWIADLENSHSQLLFQDIQISMSEASLTWTPDDLSVILDFDSDEFPDLLYSLPTGEFIEWNYTCDLLAISPKSSYVSIWCPSNSREHDFLVIEWGGDIWESAQPPGELILQAPRLEADAFPIYRIVGWSRDGMNIAYYDPQDEDGNLLIIDREGISVERVGGESIMQLDPAPPVSYSEDLIQWSASGGRLLLFGQGTARDPCPDYILEDGNSKKNYGPACWQILDTTSWEVVWNDNDIPRESVIAYSDPVVSANGEYLAVESFVMIGVAYLDLIDLSTNLIVQSSDLIHPIEMRWGKYP